MKGKIIWIIISSINFIFMTWVVGSWIEIFLKNLTSNPQYSIFNIFTFLLR